jgi:integrase
MIAENPYTAIDRLKVEESNWFEPLTDDEITTVAKHLREVKPELFVFMCFIYYSFMRPLSIVQLTADNFDFTSRLIFLEGKQHKNRKGTVKQMLEPLYDVLIEYGYDKLKPGTYFFSTGLKPGTKKITPKRASGFWNEIVIKGLQIDKKLYAVKHTGGSNYLTDNAGAIDLSWLQKQMGHSSLMETEVYVKKRTAQKLDETKASIRKL